MKDKMEGIDTIFHIGENMENINLFSDKINFKIIEMMDKNTLSKIFFNILKLYYYESEDCFYLIKELFLKNFHIIENGFSNSFLDVLKVKDSLMKEYLDIEYNDYVCAVAESGIMNVDITLPWFSIFYYVDTDLDIYPYPIRVVEMEHIVQSYDLSSEDIFLDEYIGYYIIKNGTKDQMFDIKLSLPSKYKMITSYDWNNDD